MTYKEQTEIIIAIGDLEILKLQLENQVKDVDRTIRKLKRIDNAQENRAVHKSLHRRDY